MSNRLNTLDATPIEHPQASPPRSVLDWTIVARQRQADTIADGFVWIARKIVTGTRAIVRWHQHRLIRAELAALDPHLLQDIGIDPNRLDEMVRRGAANQNQGRAAA